MRIKPDMNSLLGFSRLRIKSISAILHSNCWTQSELKTVIQAVAACIPRVDAGSMAALTANREIRNLPMLTWYSVLLEGIPSWSMSFGNPEIF